jgi:S-phase kinase-associated protein 1
MIEDLGIEDLDEIEIVPLPNVNAAILKKIIAWCTHYKNNDSKIGLAIEKDDTKNDSSTISLSEWDLEYFKLEDGSLFELILAANYLDISQLLNVCCKQVANMIKGKSAEEIRARFNIQNDFTKAEEEQIRKENEWCEES